MPAATFQPRRSDHSAALVSRKMSAFGSSSEQTTNAARLPRISVAVAIAAIQPERRFAASAQNKAASVSIAICIARIASTLMPRKRDTTTRPR